jgi:hypothetical protein
MSVKPAMNKDSLSQTFGAGIIFGQICIMLIAASSLIYGRALFTLFFCASALLTVSFIGQFFRYWRKVGYEPPGTLISFLGSIAILISSVCTSTVGIMESLLVLWVGLGIFMYAYIRNDDKEQAPAAQ